MPDISFHYRSILLNTAAIGLAAAAPAIAHAEDAAGTSRARDYLPAGIVVVGEREDYLSNDGSSGAKTPTALIDLPQSVAVVTRDQLDDQGINNLNDALRYVPGVTLDTGEGHRDQVYIRGQASTADFYLDGLRDDAQYYRPLYNVDRVEVLKGSNALIFGRGGGGGVVNRVSKSADAMGNFTALSGTVDTFGGWTLAGDANMPLSGTVAGRINATYEEFANHRDFYNGRFFGISPSLTADLGPDTRLNLNYSYDDDERVTDRGLPSFNNLPLFGYDETFFGDADFNRATTQVHILRARIDHELFDGLSVNATGQYANYDKFYANIVPSGTNGSDVTLSGYQSGTQRENLIGQVNFVGQFDTGSIGHTMLFGFEVSSQNTDADRDRVLFGGTDTSATVPLMEEISVPAFVLEAQRKSSSSLATFSTYLQDQIELTPFLQLIGGLRYDNFNLETQDFAADFLGKRRDEKWSPRLGLVVKPIENLSVYASYSQTFLPQSGDQFLVLDSLSEGLEPEKFENLELGLKWAVRPDLFFTAAIFRLDRGNTQAADPNNPGLTVLTGESRTEGFEASLTGAITSNLHVSMGYTYLDGKITSDTSSAPAGRRLQQLPEHQISAWTRYDITQMFGLGLGLVHQSEQFASISNTVALPAYTRVDAAAYVNVSDAMSFQINVENLFDEHYYPSAHGNNNIQPGAPLNASIGARVKF